MSKLLVLHNSANLEASVSRKMTAVFLKEHARNNPDSAIIVRDLVRDPIPHIPPTLITTQIFGKTEAVPDEPTVNAAIDLADTIIAEVEAADLIVIGTPLYNFTIPSTLKAWLDHLIRARRTFQYVNGAPVGLLPKGKKVLVFLASGGSYTDSPAKAFDFFEPYLRFVLAFVGLTDVTIFRSEMQAVPEIGQRNTEAVTQAIRAHSVV